MEPATMSPPPEEAVLRNHDRETHPKAGRQEARGQGRGREQQGGAVAPHCSFHLEGASSLPHLKSSPPSELSSNAASLRKASLISLVAADAPLCVLLQLPAFALPLCPLRSYLLV